MVGDDEEDACWLDRRKLPEDSRSVAAAGDEADAEADKGLDNTTLISCSCSEPDGPESKTEKCCRRCWRSVTDCMRMKRSAKQRVCVMLEAIMRCVAQPWCDADYCTQSGEAGVKLAGLDQAKLRNTGRLASAGSCLCSNSPINNVIIQTTSVYCLGKVPWQIYSGGGMMAAASQSTKNGRSTVAAPEGYVR